MENTPLSLVTGANGHLGNNLVRTLLNKGINVRASVRDLSNTLPFNGLNAALVKADITDKKSMVNALEGVHTFYAVGASFKLWAKNPVKEIYDVNMDGTRLCIEVAKEAGVKKIVYVSSIAALDYTQLPTRESNGYNPDRRNWYYNSKNDGEKLAFELSAKHGIELVSVMPSAMIGQTAFPPLSVSYGILKLVLNKEIPVDTKITLNWVDVKDVAEGLCQAAQKGRNGERYILANEQCMGIQEVTAIAKELYPELKIKMPASVPKGLLYLIAWLMEINGKIKGQAPLLSVTDLSMFSGLQQNFDISKARTELGFNPKPPRQIVVESLQYLMDNKTLFL